MALGSGESGFLFTQIGSGRGQGCTTEFSPQPPAVHSHSLVCGFALSLIGAICFVLGQITLFATLYTLGVVCSLVGTGFLLGFWKQCKMMMDPVRRYAAGESLPFPFALLCLFGSGGGRTTWLAGVRLCELPTPSRLPPFK